MTSTLTYRQIFNYFRMALVVGLLDRDSLIHWADVEIMASELPDVRVIELSLCSHRSYSWIIWRLREFQEQPDHDLPLNMVLAHAGLLLTTSPERCPELILGLRLLNDEEYLPTGVHDAITALRMDLDAHQMGDMSPTELRMRLASFLDGFASYRALLPDLR